MKISPGLKGFTAILGSLFWLVSSLSTTMSKIVSASTGRELAKSSPATPTTHPSLGKLMEANG